MTLAATGQQRRGKGGIVRWVGPRPADEDDLGISHACIDCGCDLDVTRANILRCKECRAAKIRKDKRDSARRNYKPRPGGSTGQRRSWRPLSICADCGCALAFQTETCPCVRLWCRQVEAEWMRSAA